MASKTPINPGPMQRKPKQELQRLALLCRNAASAEKFPDSPHSAGIKHAAWEGMEQHFMQLAEKVTQES